MAVVLLACSQEPTWRTRELDGAAFPGLDFALTGERGSTITEAAFRGHVTLLFFGYTYCPDVCPTTLATLSAAIDGLPDSQHERIRVLFVSVDPGRDDPARLADYTDAFGPEFVGATADVARLRRLASRYGSAFGYGERDESGNYPVSHGSSVLAFDGRGQARLLIRPEDNAEDIAHDLGRLIR
ncbi:SCO family protein [Arhodomonas sp. AD133]|uniref:SCO family protein n=1 Tax=Arhodomonas sp. AD133 TaxID=3415009 RepID=UPI003EB7CA01